MNRRFFINNCIIKGQNDLSDTFLIFSLCLSSCPCTKHQAINSVERRCKTSYLAFSLLENRQGPHSRLFSKFSTFRCAQVSEAVEASGLAEDPHWKPVAFLVPAAGGVETIPFEGLSDAAEQIAPLRSAAEAMTGFEVLFERSPRPEVQLLSSLYAAVTPSPKHAPVRLVPTEDGGPLPEIALVPDKPVVFGRDKACHVHLEDSRVRALQ